MGVYLDNMVSISVKEAEQRIDFYKAQVKELRRLIRLAKKKRPPSNK